ncbi:MAG: hypothetical protein HY822_23635 [Acidobacteria bacterium]|nr:hypothetical protein [Acidobacteriota bacterium]
MKRSQLLVAIYAVLIFGSGVLLGVVSHKAYTSTAHSKPGPRSPEEYRKRYVEEMRSRLKLSEAQMTELNSILDATRERYRQFRERDRPEMKAIQDDQTSRIRAMLNAEQRGEYEKMREEREKHMRERSKRGDR